tara:strand:- start:87618 stop:88250 length:633 start_codon:yes stop_codon:yes gene_type:complete
MTTNGAIYIVDDDDAVRTSLMVLLETHDFSVKCFQDGADFLRAVSSLPMGCVLLDLRLPNMDGLSVQRKLIEMGIHLPVIIMTGYGDVPLAVKAMQMHAVDFLEKPISIERLLEAVERALRLAVEQHDLVVRKQFARSMLENLTPRETQVFLQLIQGHPNKAAARVLGLSPRTVEVHRKHIYEKLAAKSLADLVRIAIAAGIDPSEGESS